MVRPAGLRSKRADREGREMNGVDVGAWNANWAWSLPLIVLNVVIHVICLGLINESVVRVLSGGCTRSDSRSETSAAVRLHSRLAQRREFSRCLPLRALR